MHSLFASLRLVYAPVSNLDADKLLTDDKAREWLDRAKIYMIGARKELAFSNVQINDDDVVEFDVGNGEVSVRGAIDPEVVIRTLSFEVKTIAVGEEKGQQRGAELWVIVTDKAGRQVPIIRLTPDFFLWKVSHGAPGVSISGNFSELNTFDLLYIGMSQDSAFKRLVENPHEARLKILTNELCRSASGRLSKEITFFFFDVEPLYLSTFGAEDEIDDAAVQMMVDHEKQIPKRSIVDDAEKAFIKVLGTPYNKRRYKQYPAVANGLRQSILSKYSYAIDEDLTFRVDQLEIVGAFGRGMPFADHADFILIDGEDVKFVDVSANGVTDFVNE